MSDFDVGKYILAGYSEDEPRENIRGSDAGRCVRALWAHLHQKIDIPQNFKTQLTRFDLGTEFGKIAAQRFMQGYLTQNPTNGVVPSISLESEVEYLGIKGHIDILIQLADNTMHVIEVKTNYSMRPLEPPPQYQRLQAAFYALAVGAPAFSIYTVGPAVTKDGRWERTDTYETAEYKDAVEAEYKRLGAALLDDMPEGDPKEPWRCQYCRFGACEKNVNPLKDLIGV
jgi:CRISPR/Cas system-associated exonuclease Cas4 (RecB family)